MANIPVSDLREDILDRLDNVVMLRQLPETMRVKLRAPNRVTKAMNQALSLFVRDADAATISQLSSIVDLVPDPDIGTSGVFNGVITYLWPENAFEERPRGGLHKIILNGVEYDVTPSDNLSLETLRYMAGSVYYGADYEAYSLDFANKRIYTPEYVTGKARIIEYPESINDDDTYGDTTPVPELPISTPFLEGLAGVALQELVKMAQALPASGQPESQNEEEAE